MKSKKEQVGKLRDALVNTRRPKPIEAKELLSSGSTLLDISCTGRTNGAYVKGHYYHFVGDSASGKTWLALSTFAEAAGNPRFDDYLFVYDAPEQGAIMDVPFFFGSAAADRIEAPHEGGKSSETVQEFYSWVKRIQDAGRPFIGVLDSENALRSEELDAREDKESNGEKAGGSYNTEKAKYHSSHLNRVTSRLAETGSILFIISQTRQNLGFGSKFNPKIYSGGTALKFYSTLQIWVAIRNQITVEYKGKKRQQGINAQIHIKKNRITGKDRVVEVPIYHSVGLDDVGSCVDWLIEEKRWKVAGGIVNAPDLGLKLPAAQLIKRIQDDGLEKSMRLAVAETWEDIENAIAVDRKPRY